MPRRHMVCANDHWHLEGNTSTTGVSDVCWKVCNRRISSLAILLPATAGQQVKLEVQHKRAVLNSAGASPLVIRTDSEHSKVEA